LYSLGALDRGWLRTVHEATESGLTRLILGAKTLASTPIFPDVQMPFIHFKDSINDYLIFVSGPLFGIYKSVAGVDKGLFAYDEPTLDPPVDSLVFLGGDYVVPIINGAKLGLSHPQVGDYLWDGSLLTNLNAEKITSGQLADARFLNAFLRNGSREMLGTAIMRTILPETSGIYDIGSPTSRFLGADFAGSVNCKYISPERIYWTGLIADPTYLTGQVWYRSDIRRIRFNEPAATVRNVVGNPVFEDLEFGSYKAHFGETYIERAEENWLRIKNDAGSLANLMVSGINLYYGLTTYSLDSFMQTYWSSSAYFRFRSWDGSDYRDCALLTNGRIDIPRAGDITMRSGKVLDNLAGVFRLPNTAPASPSANDCYFDPATNTLYVYNGTAWKSVVLS